TAGGGALAAPSVARTTPAIHAGIWCLRAEIVMGMLRGIRGNTQYPTPMSTDPYCCLPAGGLLAFTSACFRAAGMDTAEAEIGASALLRADLRGVDTHGVNRLSGYVRALRSGRMNPRPRLSVLRQEGAALLIDGDHGLGHVVSTRAMEICIAR